MLSSWITSKQKCCLSGSVCWTGKSSMEIEVTATSSIELPQERVLRFHQEIVHLNLQKRDSAFCFLLLEAQRNSWEALAILKSCPTRSAGLITKGSYLYGKNEGPSKPAENQT